MKNLSKDPSIGVSVLFVEDDPSVAQMYRLKLELDGFEVSLATDGEEALALAARLPDIIFLDIRLPKLDGLNVLERLGADERTRAIPVIILSNYSEDETVSRGLGLGAREFLVKSRTTPARLSARCRHWLAANKGSPGEATKLNNHR